MYFNANRLSIKLSVEHFKRVNAEIDFHVSHSSDVEIDSGFFKEIYDLHSDLPVRESICLIKV